MEAPIETQILDPEFHIAGMIFRDDGFIGFSTPTDAKQFLVKYLVSESIIGVDYTIEELLKTVSFIEDKIETNKTISSDELPYHPKKERPKKEKKFFLDGCTCRQTGDR